MCGPWRIGVQSLHVIASKGQYCVSWKKLHSTLHAHYKPSRSRSPEVFILDICYINWSSF